MIVRVALVLGVLTLLVYLYLRKKRITVGLTPLGKSMLTRLLIQAARFLLRRIGF